MVFNSTLRVAIHLRIIKEMVNIVNRWNQAWLAHFIASAPPALLDQSPSLLFLPFMTTLASAYFLI